MPPPQCAVCRDLRILGEINVQPRNSNKFHYTQKARQARLNGDDEEVNVTELKVDAFTLTAVGFGLIAFNFLVLANVRLI